MPTLDRIRDLFVGAIFWKIHLVHRHIVLLWTELLERKFGVALGMQLRLVV